MTKVSMSTEMKVPADQVWKLIGGFNALSDWHPAVEKTDVEGDGVGSVRTLSLAGGGKIVERLESVDDNERVYTYSIMDAPLPLADYVSTIRVRDEGDGQATVVEWSSEFKPRGAAENAAVQAVEDIYKAGLDNLKKMFGV